MNFKHPLSQLFVASLFPLELDITDGEARQTQQTLRLKLIETDNHVVRVGIQKAQVSQSFGFDLEQQPSKAV